MSDIIFSEKVREMIYDVLVENKTSTISEYDSDDIRNLAFYGVKGIKEFTDEELYRAVWNVNYWNDSDLGEPRDIKRLEFYKLVESEYGVHKMLKASA